jgi:hypothetical protein
LPVHRPWDIVWWRTETICDTTRHWNLFWKRKSTPFQCGYLMAASGNLHPYIRYPSVSTNLKFCPPPPPVCVFRNIRRGFRRVTRWIKPKMKDMQVVTLPWKTISDKERSYMTGNRGTMFWSWPIYDTGAICKNSEMWYDATLWHTFLLFLKNKYVSLKILLLAMMLEWVLRK